MFLQVHDELLRFHVFPTGGVELATEAARNYRALRAEGHTVRKTINCWIATFCLMSGHELLHRDRDFDPFAKVLGIESSACPGLNLAALGIGNCNYVLAFALSLTCPPCISTEYTTVSQPCFLRSSLVFFLTNAANESRSPETFSPDFCLAPASAL